MDMASYFIQAMLMILLAVVGALVLWLHFRFQKFKSAEGRLPILSDNLAQNLAEIQKALGSLKQTSFKGGDEADAKMRQAERLITDLDFMMSRAEKMIKRLEESNASVDGQPQKADYFSSGRQSISSEREALLHAQKEPPSVYEQERSALGFSQKPASSLQGEVKIQQANVAPAASSASRASVSSSNVYALSGADEGARTGYLVEEAHASTKQTQNETPRRMVTSTYGLGAYASTISRDENKPSEVEEDLRRVLEGRLS